jgi:hypothetical protein
MTTEVGRKYDSGKPEYGLIPAKALDDIAKVLTIGAQKYSRENWKQVPDGPRRYFDALQRHSWAYKAGELTDPETGLPHLAHAAACLLFLLELENIKKQNAIINNDTVHS